MAGTKEAKRAVLYRMALEKHVCPYGLKARHLLRAQGYKVEDHPLRTREETDAFKALHGVKTTPQAFIAGERVGGYTDLRAYFGKPVHARHRHFRHGGGAGLGHELGLVRHAVHGARG